MPSQLLIAAGILTRTPEHAKTRTRIITPVGTLPLEEIEILDGT